jgi:nitrile hydratase
MRARALEALLVEKGIISTDAIDAVVQAYEEDIGPRNGAKVVARAWVDPEFKARLLADGRSAVAELGLASGQGAELQVVENTPETHNLIVCTLCSCYPAGLLGLPPKWYKDFAYRSRAVIEPRSVLRSSATWSSRNDPPGPRGSPRTSWPSWSRATR